MAEQKRVDPDAMLASIDKEDRGTLTVFLGAAAGVGKTFAMLEAAQELLQASTDIVIGWVETHGRKDTEALLQGIPIHPPLELDYKGRTFKELDVDGLIARSPHVAIIDELAHTNIPGVRHTKRYQDIEDILSAGINVYTALNIQHLESLNDIVMQITEIRIRETVPDKVIENAQIQLIDLTPEDLIERLKEGKVYVPTQAQEAVKKFFRPGNLNALREMALRYTAQHVVSELETYMKAHAIDGPWPVGEKILVCLKDFSNAPALLRAGRRMSDAFHGGLIAAYLESNWDDDQTPERQKSLKDATRLAEELGAEIVAVSATKPSEAFLKLARDRNVTHMVVSYPKRFRLRDLLSEKTSRKLVLNRYNINVHVIAKEGPDEALPRFRPARPEKLALAHMGVAALILACVTAIGLLFIHAIGQVNLALLYLLPVIYAALKGGRRYAIVTAILCMLIFDFMFVTPFYSFSVSDIRYLLSFFVFIFVGTVIGTMTSRLNNQIQMTQQREERISALFSISKKISGTNSLEMMLDTISLNISETIGCDSLFLVPDPEDKPYVISENTTQLNSIFDDYERAVASWVYEQKQSAGRDTMTLSGAKGHYIPLIMNEECHGVLGVFFKETERTPMTVHRDFLSAVSSLTATVIARTTLTQRAEEAHLLKESEKLHTAILNSVSHDLHTPLTSILGSVTGLLKDKELYSPNDERELLLTIEHEANRMNRLVNNLLDMTRLESGTLELKKQWCDIEDIIGIARADVESKRGARAVRVTIPDFFPLVYCDYVLIGQVLTNLLDNAVKYSPDNTPINISAETDEARVFITLYNESLHLDAFDVERIFDKFYRGESSKSVVGSGLGLAICKGFVEAHGGRIRAKKLHRRGLRIIVILPIHDKMKRAMQDYREGDDE